MHLDTCVKGPDQRVFTIIHSWCQVGSVVEVHLRIITEVLGNGKCIVNRNIPSQAADAYFLQAADSSQINTGCDIGATEERAVLQVVVR